MDPAEALQRYREQINQIDAEIVAALSRRLAVCQAVGHFKKAHGIAMMQPARVAAVKQRCAEMGRSLGLRPEFLQALYTVIIDEACALETEIIGEEA